MPAVKKPSVKARSKPRVESTEPSAGKSRGSVAHRETASEPLPGGVISQLGDGRYFISYQSSELVPVAQFANVTIGPVQMATITSGGREAAEEELEGMRESVGDLISRDRGLVEESVRLFNEREEEEAERKKKR